MAASETGGRLFVDLSICILTHCQPDLLPRCVSSCFTEIKRAGIEGEVIVIDNASSDGSPQQVKARFPEVHLLRNEENLGFSAANNQAIRISTGQYVLILNDDAILQQDSLKTLLQVMESDPRIGAAGPKLLNPDGSTQLWFTNKRFPRLRGVLLEMSPLFQMFYWNPRLRAFFTDFEDPELSCRTDHLAGACLLAKREALRASGLFDEGFQFWCEDVDLCYRIKQAGWGVAYVAEARVVHYGSASFRKIGRRPEQAAIYYTSIVRFMRKHSSRAKYNAFRAFMIPALVCRAPVAALYGMLKRGPRLAEVSGAVRTSWVVLRSMFARNGLRASGSGTTSEVASSGR